MLRITRMPAVALEVGYLTNPGDANKLSQPIFRDTLAKAIAESVMIYLKHADKFDDDTETVMAAQLDLDLKQ